ncbi:MAG: type II secretion system protein GspN [Myxococcales bacterium]|nr:type II secretion system protein GspN [Myxococcales bacterium]
MDEEAKSSGLRGRLFIGAAAVLLTLTLMYARFPYERLIPGAEMAFEEATGIGLRIGQIDPWPSLLGPGLSLGPLRVDLPVGARLTLEEMRVRPAWSLSWLRGDATLALEFQDEFFEGRVLLGLGEPTALSGQFVDLDLSSLHPKMLAKGLAVDGFSDVDLDLVLGEAGTEGRVRLNATQGSLRHPQLPMDLPFESIVAELQLGGDSWLTVESFEIDSPLLAGGLSGTVGPPPGSQLDLRGEFETKQAARAPLRTRGLRVARDGSLSVSIQGAASRPLLR